MRVVQASHNFHIKGGSDRVFFETTRLLEAAGHSVIPYCTSSTQNDASEWDGYFPTGAASAAPRAKDTIRYFYNRLAKKNLARLLDEIGSADIAHLHIYHGKHTPSILPVFRQRGIPVVQTLHEYKLACPVYTLQRHGENCELCVAGSGFNCLRHRCKDGSLLRSGVMLAESKTARLLGDVRLVDRFICVSDFQRQIMQRAGIPSEQLVTLHNFVDTAKYSVSDHNNGYLLYFGRLEVLKGLPTLIDAVAMTGQRLLIAGDGAWKGAMLERIAGLANVSYAGFLSGEPLSDLIRHAKAVVVPSQWYENCPMSVLESKAHGVPVIGARIGGIPELVRHGKDGFLFEPGKTKDLIRVLHALEDIDQNAYSHAARADAEARFSAKCHLQGLTDIYRDVGAAEPVIGNQNLHPNRLTVPHPAKSLRSEH